MFQARFVTCLAYALAAYTYASASGRGPKNAPGLRVPPCGDLAHTSETSGTESSSIQLKKSQASGQKKYPAKTVGRARRQVAG